MDPLVLRNGLIAFILFAVSLCLRAYAQAWLANRFGDRTPALEGRLTTNPVVHADLLGTVALPLIFIFYLQPTLDLMNFRFFLGWAKPVPINPYNFKNPKRGAVLVQFAGFGISVLLCALAAVGGGLGSRFEPKIAEVLGSLIIVNSSLIVLDWIPLPPLPGGTLLRHLGYMSEETYWNIARWGGLVLIILVNIKPIAQVLTVLQMLVAMPFVIVMQMLGGL